MKTNIVGFLKIAMLAVVLIGLNGIAKAPIQGETKTKQETQQSESQESVAEAERVSINRADSETLQSLPRIGPKIAQRIIDFREQHGPFEKLEDLMNVSGIGEKTFARLAPLIKL